MKASFFFSRSCAVLALSFCSLFFVSCDQRGDVQEAREDLKDEQQDVREAQQDEAQKVLDEKRDVYREEVNVRIAKLDSTMQVLEDRAEKAKGKAKQKYEEELAVLRTKRESFNTRMDDIKNATAEAWEDTKTGVNTALNDLEAEYNKVVADIKK